MDGHILNALKSDLMRAQRPCEPCKDDDFSISFIYNNKTHMLIDPTQEAASMPDVASQFLEAVAKKTNIAGLFFMIVKATVLASEMAGMLR